MQMQRIKKVASGALGLFLTGATLLSPVLAADLSDFQDMAPANTQIVVGANAKTIDVVGGINIGAKLAQSGIESATCSVSCEGGATTVTDGVKIETSSKKLYLESSARTEDDLAAVKSTISGSDIDFLEKQSFTYDDGTTTDMNQYVELQSNTYVTFSKDRGLPQDVKIDDPRLIMYNAKSAAMYKLTLTFPTGLDIRTEDNNGPGVGSREIEIMGRSFTFGVEDNVGNTSLELFGGGEEKTLIAGGDAITFELDGATHTIRMTSWTDDGTLKGVFEIDGAVQKKSAGSSITLDATTNSEITIKEVTTTSAPSISGGAATEGATATIFIGSAKLTIANGAEVEKGDDQIDGAVASIITSTADKISKINITYSPDTAVALEEGETFVDPVFGAFEFAFTGMTPALDADSRDDIAIERSGDAVKITVPTKDGYELAVETYELDATTGNFSLTIDGEKFFVDATDTGVGVNEFVLVSDGEYSNVLEFTDIDADDDIITFEDLASGDDIEVSYSGAAGSGAGTLYIGSVQYAITSVDDSAETFTIAGWATGSGGSGRVPIMSNNGAAVTLVSGTSGSTAKNLAGTTGVNITVNEVDAVESESGADGALLSFIFNKDSNGDVAYSTYGGFTPVATDDSDIYEAITPYGTYVTTNADADVVDIAYPDDQAYVNVYLMKAGVDAPEAGATTGSTRSQTVSVDVPSLGSGVSKLDTEITDADKQSKNLILVGGPYVNSLVAELAQNDKTPDAAYWSENLQGSYIIQTVANAFATGKTAIVVAGWEGEDTKDASLKLATEDLSGEAIVCTGTSCSDFEFPAEEEEAAESE